MTPFFSRLGWAVTALLAAAVAAASARFFFIDFRKAIGPAFADSFEIHKEMFLLHISGGILALLIGPLQFSKKMRERFLNVHRWMGRFYLFGVFGGGIGGFYMATVSQGGLPTHVGFGMLAALWLITGFAAYNSIRKGEVEQHREWMIRNYSLTFGAVTLRLWMPVLLSLGYDFNDVYITISWLSWAPNLLLAELFIGMRRPNARSSS